MQATPASRAASYAIRTALICALALAGGAAAAAAGDLFPDPLFTTPFSATVVSGDFNGDGAIDLASAGLSSPYVTILLSDGQGRFEPGPAFATAGHPTSLAAADFNADGRIDLAVAEYANSIAIFFGQGDGSFLFIDRYPIGPTPNYNPSFIAAADLNLDGAPDLAVASPTADVSVFYGMGDGTFHGSLHFASGRGNNSLAVLDFNLDGFPDIAIATANESYEGVVLFALGNWDFAPAVPIGGDMGGLFICTADFNRDGKPDLAVSHNSVGHVDSHVSMLLGDGTGRVLSRTEIEIPVAQVPARGLGAADFDGDGVPDLSVSEGVLPGLGDGTFGPLIPYLPQFAAMSAIADLDADGFPDLAAPNGLDGIAILYNDRAGQLGPRIDPPRSPIWDLVQGDFNGDGLADLVGTREFPSPAFIVMGQPGGMFGPESEIPTAQAIVAMAPGDFDGDGRLDLATVQLFSDSIFLRRGLGNGAFQEPVETVLGFQPGTLVTGEFNGDGRDDLAAFNIDLDFRVLLARADGTFEVGGQIGPPIEASAAVVGDFDSDGRQDLAVGYRQTQSVTIFSGHGDGTFDTRGSYGAGYQLSSLVVADLNEDGKLDIVSGHAPGPIMPHPGPGPGPQAAVSILLGNGDTSFAEQGSYDVGRFGDVGIADFDRDGHLDILSGSSSILFGTGDGTFGRGHEYAHRGQFVIEDFNQDGGPDIALVDNRFTGIVVALNLTAAPLAAHANAETEVECASHEGAEVLLDGAASTGDIATFEWFEDYGQTGQMLLGTGETLHVTLAPGAHHITLRVTDPAGAQATDEITVTIADSVAPEIAVQLTPDQLWPANNKMIEVTAHVTATDACGGPIDIKLTSIQEEGFAANGNGKPGGNVSGADLGTADFSFQLRAARPASKQGAAYRITYTATDAAGNHSTATGVVLVTNVKTELRAHGRARPPKP